MVSQRVDHLLFLSPIDIKCCFRMGEGQRDTFLPDTQAQRVELAEWVMFWDTGNMPAH